MPLSKEDMFFILREAESMSLRCAQTMDVCIITQTRVLCFKQLADILKEKDHELPELMEDEKRNAEDVNYGYHDGIATALEAISDELKED